MITLGKKRLNEKVKGLSESGFNKEESVKIHKSWSHKEEKTEMESHFYSNSMSYLRKQTATVHKMVSVHRVSLENEIMLTSGFLK